MGLKVTPLGDRVVVRPLETADVTPGGIVLPDAAKEKPTKGKVLSVGLGGRSNDGLRRPLEVLEGDVVYFTKYAGTPVEIDSEELVILREDELLAKEG